MRKIILLSIFSMLFICNGLLAKTPDGEPPDSESVCDILLDATLGLYGLCVAFCEAQDCEPSSKAHDLPTTCRPSAQKLLEIYNRKKEPGDPDMPCLLPACPCFSEADIPEWHTHCWIDQIIYGGGGLNTVVWDCPQGCQSATCTLFNGSYAGVSIFPEKSCYFRDPSISRFFLVSDAEYHACRTLVVNAINHGDTDCSCGLLQVSGQDQRRHPRIRRP